LFPSFLDEIHDSHKFKVMHTIEKGILGVNKFLPVAQEIIIMNKKRNKDERTKWRNFLTHIIVHMKMRPWLSLSEVSQEILSKQTFSTLCYVQYKSGSSQLKLFQFSFSCLMCCVVLHRLEQPCSYCIVVLNRKSIVS